MKPDLATLLVEVPSPPIDKLYGRVLEAYLGTASPFKNKLAEGATRRNRLLHCPMTEHIELEKAMNYTAVVRKAIFDLLARLTPNDPFAPALAGSLTPAEMSNTQDVPRRPLDPHR